ncbi:MAG TPA: GNAT family N-acetyltransferase [Firmicutes bacterium]|nr:GNAT family N-acetyltransferase [Bacillota bacterium]
MIQSIDRTNIDECVEVIQSSFLTVANEFGLTEQNAPRFTAFAVDSAQLHQQFDEKRPMYAYFDDHQVIGYYSLQLQDDGDCELKNLCVLPKYRHKKIGEKLFVHATSIARQNKCKAMNIGIVEENVRLKKWYEKLGANHMGTKKFDFLPFTCGYMKLDLSTGDCHKDSCQEGVS